jgi:hypothetical protein
MHTLQKTPRLYAGGRTGKALMKTEAFSDLHADPVNRVEG